ncbi:MAG: CDP-alcohol phosphatidyltransferase family protein [Patescibacteria group bacterium]
MRDPHLLYPHDVLMKPIIHLIPDVLRPNHFTIARMILTPVVLFLLFFENYGLGVPLFILTAFTDAIDGSLARIRDQITDWGTFYDPVADKLFIGSVILLILIQHVNPLLGYIIIFLECLMVIGGWYKRRSGQAVQANVWGKVKMFLQFAGVFFLLMSLWFGIDMFIPISYGTLILGLIFAIVALLTYSL